MTRRYIKSVEKSTMEEIKIVGKSLELGIFDENNLQRLHHLLQDAFTQTTLDIGAGVMTMFLEREVELLCGAKYSRQEGRNLYRYGKQQGSIYMSGQKIPIRKQRVRQKDGREKELATYKQLQDPSRFEESVLQKMLHGVSCRKYDEVIDHASERLGIKKSSVSEAFRMMTKKKLAEFESRPLHQDRWLVIFVDGKPIGGEMMISALGINKAGKKGILGFRQGSTENAQVAKDLLTDMRERGLNTDAGVLFVIDGSKALRNAIREVFGERAYVQRCRVHKKRNVMSYLSDENQIQFGSRLDEAYKGRDHDKAKDNLLEIAKNLDKVNLDAGSSLREGLEETLTVLKFKLPEVLLKTLLTTNPMESMNSVLEEQIRRVKHWRGNDMRKRWAAAGFSEAEKHANRIRGHRHLEELEEAMKKDIEKRFGKLDESKEVA